MESIKSTVTKIGGSLFILIPYEHASKLELTEGADVLLSVQKYVNKIRELCEKHKNEKNMVILNVEGDDMIGNIMEVKDKFVYFQSGGEFYTLPFQSIKEVRLDERSIS